MSCSHSTTTAVHRGTLHLDLTFLGRTLLLYCSFFISSLRCASADLAQAFDVVLQEGTRSRVFGAAGPLPGELPPLSGIPVVLNGILRPPGKPLRNLRPLVPDFCMCLDQYPILLLAPCILLRTRGMYICINEPKSI